MKIDQVNAANELLNKIRILTIEFSNIKDLDGFEKGSRVNVMADFVDFDTYKIRLSQRIAELETIFNDL
jgi:hypothetical protein